MLPRSWKPIPSSDLIRMGPPNDGGYIVSAAAIDQAETLVSFGLNAEWGFEAAFVERTGGRVICFDGAVTAGFWRWHALVGLLKLKPRNLLHYFQYRKFFSGRAEHRLEWIGYNSLHTILGEIPEGDVFLKMDIEGSEYRVLPDILANAHRFTGMAMELHDVDFHRDRITAFLDALPGFQIVSLRPNNIGGRDSNGDPFCIEISLARADLLSGRAGDDISLAHPNNPGRPDLVLAFDA